MEKYKRRIFAVVIIATLSMLLQQSVLAGEERLLGKEVVFVLDASGSMKTNDSKRLAIDGIAQLVYTLPSDYSVGAVVYNTDVVMETKPVADEQRKSLITETKKITYTGYSNVGAGISRAVEMLNGSSARNKTIVLISDGEILLADENSTQQAEHLYRETVRQAKENGITIHAIGLGGEMEDERNSIFTAAEQTGGGIYYTSQAEGIQSAVDDILTNRMGIRQMTAAIADTDGKIKTFSLDMPFANASKVRILLAGNTVIENLNTNFQAESAEQISGERYALTTMTYPKGGQVEVSFSGAAGSRVSITMIPEYQVKPKAEITYRDTMPEKENGLRYEREASVICRFYDLKNQNIQLWTEGYFQHGRMSALMKDADYDAALEQGQFLIKAQVTEQKTENIVFDYSSLPVNVIDTEMLTIELEEPPALSVGKLEHLYLLIGLVIGAVLVFIIIGWVWKHPTPLQPPQDEKPEPGKYSYVGKLNIYITRAPSGYDIPPLSYDLFRLPSGKVISLREVLESCDIKEHFAGAEQIYFKSDAGRNIILTNNSDCTILRSREILMKKKSYQIPAGTKMDVAFEDEISELTIQYKDLKPSEMW